MSATANHVPAPLTEFFTSRLLAGSIPEPNSGCWLWEGAHRDGYGMLAAKGQRFAAHRLSWLLFRGPIPPKHDVCHRCDTPACVNPDHLFAGTRSQNIRDAANKRRLSTQKNPDLVRGENSGRAILTDADVIAIRNGGPFPTALARRFGVSLSCVQHIRFGRTWRHLLGEAAQ